MLWMGWLSLGWIVGLILLGAHPLPPVVAVFAAGAGTLSLRVTSPVRYVVLGASVAVLAAGQLATVHVPRWPQGGTARISVDVGRTACGARSCWAQATLHRCAPVDRDACLTPGTAISVLSEEELPAGARMALLARIRVAPSFRNPLPTWAWPFGRTEATAVAVEGVPPRQERSALLGQALVRARRGVREALDRSLTPPHQGIARALLLGEGIAVDRALNDAIRSSGVSHILAVSGMHVTVLAGALVWLVRGLWLRSPLALRWEARRAAAAMGMLLAPLVAAFAGGAPSACRAASMSTLTYALVAWGRRPCPLAVCAASALLSMLAWPHDALHPGFVLSLLATSALLTLDQADPSPVSALREGARIWVATAPFLCVCFGTVQVVSVMANVLLAPIAATLIPLVAGHALCALWLPPLARLSAWLFEAASGAFVVGAKLASHLDPKLTIPSPTSLQALALAGIAALFLAQAGRRTRVTATLLCLSVFAIEEVRLRHPLERGEVRFTFIDVGQGDATLIETEAGQHALVDGGGAVTGGPDPGEQAILPLLRSLRVDALDLVVLSHPHPDHYGGLAAVLDHLPVAELWDTGQACAEDSQGAACALVSRARARGTRVRGPLELCAMPRVLPPLRLKVIAPCPGFDEGYGPNDNSFVLRAEHGQRSVLLTGDIEQAAEANLVSGGAPIRADVLKVGHHGSRTSTTAPFLAKVSPRVAVISAGRSNRFGHPHGVVLDRLKARGVRVLRLDQVGGLQVVSDGARLRVDGYDREMSLEL